MLLSIPCLPGDALFKLSLFHRVKYQLYQYISIKFNRKMKSGNTVRWQMKISVVNYNHKEKSDHNTVRIQGNQV